MVLAVIEGEVDVTSEDDDESIGSITSQSGLERARLHSLKMYGRKNVNGLHRLRRKRTNEWVRVETQLLQLCVVEG